MRPDPHYNHPPFFFFFLGGDAHHRSAQSSRYPHYPSINFTPQFLTRADLFEVENNKNGSRPPGKSTANTLYPFQLDGRWDELAAASEEGCCDSGLQLKIAKPGFIKPRYSL
jgi:hypothetical protein